jgi:N6-L-threonylcarbamoyladenine synthase
MIILGIETSCDETALALIETRTKAGDIGTSPEFRVINSLVHSQADLHSAYGGVYPSLAKREHGKNIVALFHKLVSDSGLSVEKELSDTEMRDALSQYEKDISASNPELWQTLTSAPFLRNVLNIDRIAVTEGPGLELALWVGISFARILATLWNKPLEPVNHMEGHIVGSLIESDKVFGSWQSLKPLTYPAIALLVSGGHTQLIRIAAPQEYSIIGDTKDDAAGEAFDKAARLLDLPYPGGPHLSELARKAREEGVIPKIKLPRPMIHTLDLDFSFSGLKTAVLYAVREGDGSDDFKKQLAVEFEDSVVEVLTHKTRMAIDENSAQALIVGGGVSANTVLRESLDKLAREFDIPIYLPTPHLSGDNALMIALAASICLHPVDNSRPIRANGTKSLDQTIQTQ